MMSTDVGAQGRFRGQAWQEGMHRQGRVLRRRIPRASLGLGLILAGVLGSGCGSRTPVAQGPKNIVLISLDTLRADHLGAYGDQRGLTPTLDSLASEGLVFERTIAPAPTTLASHTSMLTGTYPQTHGVVRNGFPVHPDNQLLAETLAEVGFHTAAFLGSFALDSRFGLDQGFHRYDQAFDSLVTDNRDQNQRSAEAVTQAVLRHLDDLGETPERTFLFVHYFDAHLPYEPPTKWAQRFSSDPEVLELGSSAVEAIVQAKHRDWHGIEPESPRFGNGRAIANGLEPRVILEAKQQAIPEEQLPASLYAAEVAAVDEAIADLLRGLEERGYLQDALVIVSGDHGETFWEHGDLWNHGLWVYQTTLHVPWIMRWTGAPWAAGTRIAANTSTVDLVPTLLELLELPAPDRMDGVSALPWLQEPERERGPLFAVATQPYHPEVERRDERWRNARKPHAVLWGDWKYVRSHYNDIEELYHLASDPGERTNWLRAAEGQTPPGVTAEDLRATHERLSQALGDYQAQARPLPSEYDPSQARETAQRLQAIGYGEGSD